MQATAGGISHQTSDSVQLVAEECVFFQIRENYGKILIREDGGKEG